MTEWKHPDKGKLSRLKNKIKDYRKNGFEVILYIPKNFRKFYKEFNDSIVSALLEIKAFLMP